jgi:Leucine-rich repeat (LRR) protein
MFAVLPAMLNLDNFQLTHLPTQIGYLKSLTGLNLNRNKLTILPSEMTSLTKLTYLFLRGNTLSPENVKNICTALPSLQSVIIDSDQPALVEMFDTENFSHFQVTVTQIFRENESI